MGTNLIARHRIFERNAIQMRLTLRTLLAYRDGVLDSQDAARLEAKINDSSTAQQISQRIEEGMRNRKLAPIPVDAREFGFEANLVAEYLDDTIAMEALPEMERKCLENNTLLSEVGSCHQILSRALTVPASIPNSLRERIRELPTSPALNLTRSFEKHGLIRRIDRPAESSGNVVAATIQSGSETNAASQLRKRNVELRTSGIELSDGLGRQVPEYLIGSDRGWWRRAAMAMCLLASLIMVGAMAIGPWDRVGQLLRKTDGAGAALVPETSKGNEASSLEKQGPVVSSLESTMPAPKIQVEPIPEKTLEPLAPEATAKEPVVAPNPSLPRNDASSPSVPIASIPTTTDNASKSSPAAVSSVAKSESAFRMQWLPENKSSSESIVFSKIAEDHASDLGWKRLSPGEFVQAGERIVIAPAQRTEIRIEPGIRWLCAGESDLELMPSNKIARVALKAGRSLVFATPDAQSVEVDCNGILVSVRFAAPDACCAFEVLNELRPASDEALQAGALATRTTVRLIGVQGELEFSAQGFGEAAERGTISVGQYVMWKDEAFTKHELVEAPWWFRTSVERPIDQHAATDLQRALSRIEPQELDSELLALTNHRRSETAALAARTRMMLGQFDSLFSTDGVLNRKGMHSHWNLILGQISQSLGRPENRVKLVDAIKMDSPHRFGSLLSLLTPKTQLQLAGGADKLLIESLASSSLDERVLAIHQLFSITGKSLGYQPDKTSIEAIQQWRKSLGKGEIRYAETPGPS
jgi:hypothetical protein